jgi:cation diffusion facilitator CzcD-associated flavoprotein CzcO
LPPPPVADGGHTKVLILGAGYGALLFAVRLLETGVFKANDIVFVDAAGGFGGVWY